MIDGIIKEGSRLVHVCIVNGESVIGVGKMKRWWCWIVEQLRENLNLKVEDGGSQFLS
uniref:Uncharacterized protein n=1 Tax=Medicago truncatula TaxID=3880 RepID=A4PU45_MEDTR|nr:hypothetical protein MtrDRAFT_AC144563g1v2 [Medicago truncatula]